jgi:hypothetical protein
MIPPRRDLAEQPRMRFRFSMRDFLWLALVVVPIAGWWVDHRYAAKQLNFCIEALDQTAEELEEVKTESEKYIAALRSDLDRTERARRSAETRAAINAERPLPTPGPFIRP